MYDTDFDITYNFQAVYQSLNFNKVLSISDLYFLNRRSFMVILSVSSLVVIFYMAAANINSIL